MPLTNIQSIESKLDMLIHHMQLNSLDICFITETWTQCGSEPDYQYIRANLDTAGYNIMIHSRENRNGVGIAVIYRPHLHVKKYSLNEHTSFEAITINLNITTKPYLLSTIYRVPYSSKKPVTMQTFLEEFQTIFHLYSEVPGMSSSQGISIFTGTDQSTQTLPACKKSWTCMICTNT